MKTSPRKTVSQIFVGLVCVSVLALTGCDKGGAAKAEGNDNQKKREAIMKEFGNANKTMGGMVKDPTTFNAEGFKAAGAKLNQDAWSLFTADSKGGRAKDEVWAKSDEFKAEVDKYKSAVVALNTAAQTATNADAVKLPLENVGATCKSCHDKFRKPE